MSDGENRQGDWWQVNVCTIDGVTLVTVSGEIDLAAEAALNRVFEGIASDQHIIVDCADVPFMHSTGLHVLLQYSIRARAAGGSLHVRNPSEQVDRLLQLAALDELLDA